MRWFDHISINSKIILVICCVLLSTLVMGGAGVFGLAQANQSAADLYEEQMLPLNTVGQAVENLLIASSSFDMAILAADEPQTVEGYRADVERLNRETQALLATFGQSSMSGKARAAYDKGLAAFTDVFLPAAPQVFALIKAGDVEGANTAMEAIDGRIGDMIDQFRVCKAENAAAAAARDAEIGNVASSMTTLLLVVFGVSFLFVTFIGVSLNRTMTRPIGALTAVAEQVGQTGNLRLDAKLQAGMKESAHRRDEFGRTARAFQLMVDVLQEKAAVLERIAQGDLSAEVAMQSEQDVLGSALQQMSDQLNAMFAEISSAAAQVTAGSAQVAQAAQTLASGTTQQAASVQQFSASLQQVSAKVEGNAEKARQSLKVTNHAGELMGGSMASMNAMLAAMRSISESSQNIIKVIKVIDEIAFQTNILALNASVEAARAGQHGRGFAVVAEEVRNLASKSSAAAKETAQLIDQSTVHVSHGNDIVQNTNRSLELVGGSARDNLVLIQQISEACGEQTSVINDLNMGIGQISTVVQSNSATAEESAAAAQVMSAQASALQELIGRFRLREAQGQEHLAPAAAGGKRQLLPGNRY